MLVKKILGGFGMMSVLILLVSFAFFMYYLKAVKNYKFTTKTIVMIGLFSAISYILSMVKFIQYPQGGGIGLFPMLPTLLIAILYGKEVGITAGLIYGLLTLINGAYIIHPAQFLVDYILPTMVLGLAGIFGKDKKSDILKGCFLAVGLSVAMYIISGCVFFGDYAPEGMNVFVYSCIYNLSSSGVEGLLTIALIGLLPMKRLSKAMA